MNSASPTRRTPRRHYSSVHHLTTMPSSGGREVSVAEIEDYVLAETPFRETHYKRQVLVPLEQAGIVAPIDPPPRRRSGAFSDSLRLRFVAR